MGEKLAEINGLGPVLCISHWHWEKKHFINHTRHVKDYECNMLCFLGLCDCQIFKFLLSSPLICFQKATDEA